MADIEQMVYPVLSKDVMVCLMGFGSTKEFEALQRRREQEWLKTHHWVEPICAKCGKRTSSCGKVGILKTEKYYCARCSAKPTTIEINESCECFRKMKELFDSLNIQVWTDDAYHGLTMECQKHHTTATFTYVNQYD
jgi:hypothetical protein